MTKKDFTLIARAFATTRPADFFTKLTDARGQWLYSVHAMADALERANPAFNRSMFYNACEG